MIAIQTDRGNAPAGHRGLVKHRQVRIGPLTYTYDRDDGVRRLTWGGS